MKISLIPINVGVSSIDEVVALAQTSEAAGLESVWTFEHVIIPLEYASRYPYHPTGKMPITPNTNMLDPLITLTAVAQHTKTLRLGTGINILPQTNPLYLAKQAATLDLLSKGRLMLGLGIGWLEEEFDALGVPFAKRGARFDDYVQAMRKVWAGDVVEHQSEFLSWSQFKSYPLPQQKTLPVIVGGSQGKAFERIARYGDGWYAPVNNPVQLKLLLSKLQTACNEIGRDMNSIEITAMWEPKWAAEGGLDTIKKFADLGVSRLTVPLFMLGKNPLDGIKRLGDEMVGKV